MDRWEQLVSAPRSLPPRFSSPSSSPETENTPWDTFVPVTLAEGPTAPGPIGPVLSCSDQLKQMMIS